MFNLKLTPENKKELKRYGYTDVVACDTKRLVVRSNYLEHTDVEYAINFLNSAKNRGCEIMEFINSDAIFCIHN